MNEHTLTIVDTETVEGAPRKQARCSCGWRGARTLTAEAAEDTARASHSIALCPTPAQHPARCGSRHGGTPSCRCSSSGGNGPAPSNRFGASTNARAAAGTPPASPIASRNRSPRGLCGCGVTAAVIATTYRKD